ncbi:DNA circularization protein [Denitromonas halophila]|uniref:DNA circulation family protein n=1 Tax=Denitromonas halophila TaxID=1629404 RepID=A0A557QX90_9RHOO|nr:DNA circularization N-terminal domain-containing protein [Denitromonas halophila]TVO57521.1 DNA circulation family protein [Denitromonas halophila]
MAWADSLLECTFRGVALEVLSTSDGAARALALHTYPWVDGADVEDMGREPRSPTLTALFYGDDYEARLKAAIAVFDQAGAGELVHPVFGAMNVHLRRYGIEHEADGVDQARVSLEFVEARDQPQPFYSRALPVQQAQAVSAQSAVVRSAAAGAVAGVIERLRASAPLKAFNELRETLLAPITQGLAEVQGVVLSGADVLTEPRAWANDLASLVDGMVDTRDFTSDVMTDWRAVSTGFGRFDALFGSGTSSVSASVTPTESQAAEAAKVTTQVTVATGQAENAAALLGAEAETPTLTPVDIETVANAARAALDAAIEAVRALYPLETARRIVEPLRAQALAVQEAAQAIIEARPPLVVRTLTAPGNLRLIAHRLYGDHTRAPELWRLNTLRTPNALNTGDRINAYAQ